MAHPARARNIRRRRESFFLDPGEQPGLNRGGRSLLFSMIVGETAGFEDYGAQLGDAAAARVVEAHKRKAGLGHRILQERDRRSSWQAMRNRAMTQSSPADAETDRAERVEHRWAGISVAIQRGLKPAHPADRSTPK